MRCSQATGAGRLESPNPQSEGSKGGTAFSKGVRDHTTTREGHWLGRWGPTGWNYLGKMSIAFYSAMSSKGNRKFTLPAMNLLMRMIYMPGWDFIYFKWGRSLLVSGWRWITRSSIFRIFTLPAGGWELFYPQKVTQWARSQITGVNNQFPLLTESSSQMLGESPAI